MKECSNTFPSGHSRQRGRPLKAQSYAQRKQCQQLSACCGPGGWNQTAQEKKVKKLSLHRSPGPQWLSLNPCQLFSRCKSEETSGGGSGPGEGNRILSALVPLRSTPSSLRLAWPTPHPVTSTVLPGITPAVDLPVTMEDGGGSAGWCCQWTWWQHDEIKLTSGMKSFESEVKWSSDE